MIFFIDGIVTVLQASLQAEGMILSKDKGKKSVP
jgi:hypothetical protein